MRMQGYCDVYKWTILKRTSPEVKCLHPTSSRREMCTSSVSNMIYHKFSHGGAFYTLNGKNVNVMLEFVFDKCSAFDMLRPLNIRIRFTIGINEKFDIQYLDGVILKGCNFFISIWSNSFSLCSVE